MQHTPPSTPITVVKRSGEVVPLDCQAVWDRYQELLSRLPRKLDVDLPWLTGKTIQGIAPGMRTDQIDKLAEEVCAFAGPALVDYQDFAAAIRVDCMHKEVPSAFLDAMDRFSKDCRVFGPNPEMLKFAADNCALIDAELSHDTDYTYEYPSVHMADSSYILRLPDGRRGERIQHMYMRVALGLCRRLQPEDGAIFHALNLYRLLRDRKVSLATPVIRSAGTNQEYMISCFLSRVGDSIEDMYDKVREFAVASKRGGGMGMCVSEIRCRGSPIRSSGGLSKGVASFLEVIDATRRHLQQGSNKRSAVGAPYLELWHGDVMEFLKMKDRKQMKEGTSETDAQAHCPDLFPAVWVPDLFWKRLEADQPFSLFCPDECPGLIDSHGREFEELYEKYEREGKARATMNPKDIVQAMADSEVRHGVPYVLNKDSVNALSNQQHRGTINTANLCTEVTQLCSAEYKSCCVLGAICLGSFAKGGQFDFAGLRDTAFMLTVYVDAINDITQFPDPASASNHMKNRSIGIGVCGLADAFAHMSVPWESDEGRMLNHRIFEHIYYGCVESSCAMAKRHHAYATYKGSPASKGLLQRDLCIANRPHRRWLPLSGVLDWPDLYKCVAKYGLRNDLLTALMPTASTAALVGMNECFEPFTSNLYFRRLGSGDLLFPNRHLMRLLRAKGLLNNATIEAIVANNGSVSQVDGLTAHEKAVFKTAWEIPAKTILDLAADRQAFVSQSQSMNVWKAKPTGREIVSMWLYAWKEGLTTGQYYLRTLASTEMIRYDGARDSPPVATTVHEGACSSGGCSL